MTTGTSPQDSPILRSQATSLTTIILTFNSEASLAQVVASCQAISTRVLVVDSYSSDRTLELAHDLGCEIIQHPFENYSRQRNWAQEYAQLHPESWVLHLDSDEVLSPELAQSIQKILTTPTAGIDGYLMRRLSYFLGSPIRYGSINPSWHLRLFRAGKGCCEDRLYDQHYIVPGSTHKLAGLLLDLQLTTLEKWTAAHNQWSSAEAREVLTQTHRPAERTLSASLTGDLRMQKRWLKNNLWYRAPLFLRALVFFVYSYFFRLGFLDGRVGLVYHVLQAFWFRFLIDAKILELQMQEELKT
ncbi:glycosyltransferase family 2 protein [Anthocerotibacter panamensis]|uniref:glycosyltransferase family 2 protein n=1 Tax=Anthocerotibacter panamensis TaxID=2857077 RepID=UPI001C402349|nr:glycosyltransferase family 2 protein [Anthocerotibacter panamensis]